MLIRIAGMGLYKQYFVFSYRAEISTREKPNLVPAHFDFRIVGCMCEPDSGHVNFMVVRKGLTQRCECGAWYKAIDADPESV